MAKPLGIVLLLLAVICPSCSSSRSKSDPWTYGITRSAFPSLFDGSSSPQRMSSGGSNCLAAIGGDPFTLALVGAVIAVPFVVDTVLLPITIPRDLLVAK